MKSRLLAVLALLPLLLAGTQARAQCTGWHPGPLDNGTAVEGTDGPVYAMTMWDPDGTGPKPAMLVVGGSFTEIEGVPVNNLAARDPVTGKWQAFTTLGLGPVYALTVYNGDLIVGGQNIYRWTGSQFVTLGGGLYDGNVYSLAEYNNDLIVGGSLRIFNTTGNPAIYIARWDGASWSDLAGGTNLPVRSMVLWNGDLIVGGDFSGVGNPVIGAHFIARWNGSWNLMGSGMDTGSVFGLASYNGELYAGGSFTTAGGASTGGLAHWNGAGWGSAGGYFNGTVYELAVHNGQLVIGGLFPGISGAANLVQYNGAFSNLGSGGTNGIVNALLSNGADELYIGGSFTTAGAAAANRIAEWNGTGWTPLGGGTAGSVLAMATFRGRLIAGGDFRRSAEPNAPVHDIAGWDGAYLWPFGSGMDAQVNALVSFKYPGILGNYELVAGGYFSHAGGVAANKVARWDESPYSALPPPAWQAMGVGFDSAVLALERYNGDTYAAGNFTHSGSTTMTFIARWNSTSGLWEAVGTGMNGTVYALKSYGGYLYAGGTFTTAGGVSTGGLARWDGTSWSQVGGYFGGTVNALEVYNGVLVMAGSFPGFGGSPNISTFDGSVYANLGTGGTDATVLSLHAIGGRLYVGGTFTTAGGVSASHVAYWDGAWHEASGGADNNVYALGDYNGELQAGGVFDVVGGGAPVASRAWARYSDGIPWIAHQPVSQVANPGDDVTFTADPASGYSGLSYQWYRFGVPMDDGVTPGGSTISGSHTISLTISNVSNYDLAPYFMVLANGCGTDTSLTATLGPANPTATPPAGALATLFEALGPNPTTGPTRIAFTLARAARVEVRVHDLAGRLVRRIDEGRLAAGRHRATWDGRGSDGQAMNPGLYFVRLDVDGRSIGTKRLTLLR